MTKQTLVVHRDDFWASTSSKQLDFLQQVFTILKQYGRAAIVVPDNVLFEGDAGEFLRRRNYALARLTCIGGAGYPTHCMNIDRTVIVHEAGHVLVGLDVGMREDVIAFEGARVGEGAASFSHSDDPEKWMLRCFGGVLAEICLDPEGIDQHLLEAYGYGVILDPGHPFFDEFENRERDFLPTAWHDICDAQVWAAQLAQEHGGTAIGHLRQGERRARKIVERRDQILRKIGPRH